MDTPRVDTSFPGRSCPGSHRDRVDTRADSGWTPATRMGHADIKTTMGYTHVVDTDLDSGLEALERVRASNVVPLRRPA